LQISVFVHGMSIVTLMHLLLLFRFLVYRIVFLEILLWSLELHMNCIADDAFALSGAGGLLLVLCKEEVAEKLSVSRTFMEEWADRFAK
jgi:hypothetical protein